MLYLGIEQYKDKEYLINSRGDVSLIFKVTFPPVFYLDEEALIEVQSNFSEALSKIPYGIVVERKDFIYKEFNSYNKQLENEIEEHEKRFIENTKFKKIETYFIFTSLANPSIKRNYGDSIAENITKKDKLERSHFDLKDINNLDIYIDSFFRMLLSSFTKESGISAEYVWGDLLKAVVESKYLNLNLRNNKSSNILNTIKDKDTYVKSGTKSALIYTMQDFPDVIYESITDSVYTSKFGDMSVSMLHDLYFSHNEDMIVSTYFYPIDNKKFKASINSKARFMSGFSFGSKENEINAQKLNELDEFLINSKEKIIGFHQSYILLFDGDELELQYKKNILETVLKKQGLKLNENTNQPLRKFVSYSVGNGGDIADGEKISIPVSFASIMSSFESSSRTESKHGISLRDIKTNESIIFDYKKYETRHFAIFGPTGVGKSFTINHIIDNIICSGSDVVIGDVGYSYQNLCEFYGGDYIEMNSANPLKSNPFQNFTKDANNKYILDINEIEDDIIFIVELFLIAYKGSNDSKITTEERNFMTEMILDYLRMANKQGFEELDFTHFYSKIDELVENNELLRKNKNSFDIDRFKLNTKQFIKGGIYESVFNSKNDTLLQDKRLIVFEFEKLKDNKTLFPISYFILSNIILKKIRNPKNTKDIYFVLDELHFLLKDNYGDTTPFLEYCIRTFRKWGAGFGMSTQNLTDLEASEKLKDALVNNTALFMFKKQPNSQYDKVQKILAMSENNLKKLFSINDKYREFFIYDKNGNGNLYQIDVSPYKYWLYTTNKDDKNLRNKYLEKYGDLKLAIKYLSTQN